MPAGGEETTLHTHLIVRDDALALYGFHSEQERDLFLMLLSVQAVGPKVALAVLSGGPAARADRRRSPPATPRASRRCPGSASAPPSGSSSSCARRSAARERPASDGPPIVARARRCGTRARSRATGCSSSATRRGEAEELLRDAEGDSAEELIAQRAARRRGRVLSR